jgi:hypothetical protein
MMEAARTSETLVNFYQTTRHYNPEDSHLRTHRRENLKSYFLFFVLQSVSRANTVSVNLSPLAYCCAFNAAVPLIDCTKEELRSVI